MRVTFFSDNFHPEVCPPASHVYERARLWVSWGHSVTVITGVPNYPEGKVYPGYRNQWRRVESMDGIRVVRVKTFIARNKGFVLRILDYVSFMLSGFFFALFERKPDVVISTSPQLFTPCAGLAYATIRRVPHVFELRDLWPASIIATGSMKPGRIYSMLERLELFLYRRSKRIVALTCSFADDLVRRGIAGDKIDVVVSGANLEMFSPRPRDPEIEAALGLRGRFVVGYIGTFGLAHGLHNVVAAAEALKDTEITFLLVGTGADEERVRHLVEERGLNNIVLVPRVSRNECVRYWSVCDVGLVHLKNDDLFRTVVPSKLFEAIAMGLPVLYVGPDGECAAMVRNHGVGLIVPPEHPQALADAVLRLARTEHLREAYAANSRAAASLYSREAQARGTLRALERAAPRPALRPVPAMRRALDIVAALAGMVLLAPLALVIAVVVRLFGSETVLARQEGVGQNHRPLAMWRIRLPSRPDADGYRQITLLGRFLRKYKLDRLPHLLNLLRGDLTLVGPRVRSPQEVAVLPAEDQAILDLVPGLVGPSSIRYRDLPDILDNGGSGPDHSPPALLSESARISLEYARRATLWTDLCVFIAAVLRVLFRSQFVAAVLRVCDPARIGHLLLPASEQQQRLEAALAGRD